MNDFIVQIWKRCLVAGRVRPERHEEDASSDSDSDGEWNTKMEKVVPTYLPM